MPWAVATETVPLVSDDDDVIRIEGTRVPFETVMEAFQEGATPEEIAQQYPSVTLGVLYQEIGYHLRHKNELDRYVAHRAEPRIASQALNESCWPAEDVRHRLLARRG